LDNIYYDKCSQRCLDDKTCNTFTGYYKSHCYSPSGRVNGLCSSADTKAFCEKLSNISTNPKPDCVWQEGPAQNHDCRLYSELITEDEINTPSGNPKDDTHTVGYKSQNKNQYKNL
jgi:hypothetical protein